MADDLDIRRLRHFVAVAEELHFGRAAARLHIAQQALSRDVQQLEDRAGVSLLDRTTRRVVLTEAGSLLLGRARELLALHDTTLRELRGDRRAIAVDVVGPGLTPDLVLATARRLAPQVEFFARYVTGRADATAQLGTGEIDVTFGRRPSSLPGVRSRHVRSEPIAALVPEQHPLAAEGGIPLTALVAARPCSRSGDHATPGWEDALLQLLGPFGITAQGAHPHVQGVEELARHLLERDAPVLAPATHPPVPGAVMRRVVDPVPLFPWSMTWREAAAPAGVRALHDAVEELAAEPGWEHSDDGAWLPEPERSRRRPGVATSRGATAP